ncbi:MAG: hypothetical protein B7Z55_13730 [Planctomycetales bacterium 12-60-4]|nr:MAG: hypothetical protein B7Z55_13730 [Planctomycetales bacterium 12-60-4]
MWFFAAILTRIQALPGYGSLQRSASRVVGIARQSLADMRSQAEPGNEVARERGAALLARLAVGIIAA